LEWYEERRTSAIRIQSILRSRVAIAGFGKRISSATLIQMHWRGFYARSKLFKSIVAASRIALFFRKCLAVLRLHEHQRRCAIRIQTRWRTVKAVITLRQSTANACRIQNSWRRFCTLSKFYQLIERRAKSANIIVYYWRSYQLRSTFVAWFHHRNRSAACIQSIWRSMRMLSKLESALYLLRQSLYGRASRKTAVYPLLVANMTFRSSKAARFWSLKQSGIWKCRWLETMELAAVLIQCFVRGCLCRKELGSLQYANRNRFFCMLPFKRRCDWASTMAEPLLGEKQDVKSFAECRMESRMTEVLKEQSELFSSFAASYLMIAGDNAPLMGSVSEFLDSPCLKRLAKRVRLSASSFVHTMLARKSLDSSSCNFGMDTQGISETILISKYRIQN
jgi:IQ calmodulin-binding motif